MVEGEGGSRLRGRKLPSGMTNSGSCSAAGAEAVRARALSLSFFLSFLAEEEDAAAALLLCAEERLEMRPNSSRASGAGEADFFGVEVVREREKRLGMKCLLLVVVVGQ